MPVNALESILLEGAKKIFGCFCDEAVRKDMGLDTLKSCRDKAKLKWWYKLAFTVRSKKLKSTVNGNGTAVRYCPKYR